MNSRRRIFNNTLIIYGKSVVNIAATLYATRIVLQTLGVKDFGVFNVVGGLVSMLSFLNAAMTVSTQRYISVNKGKADLASVKMVFANSIILHWLIGIFLVVLFELVGLYFLNNRLSVPVERLFQANVVYQFVIVSTLIMIVSVPYDAVINANENMIFLAIVGIAEGVLKVVTAYLLVVSSFDKLIAFGFLTMLSAIIIRILKRVYSRRKYEETHVSYRNEYSVSQLKELGSFAGWNLFGSFSYVLRNQGLVILLNIYFGPAVNAAYAIANQVAGQLSFFCSALLQAINPQIMKSSGASNRENMLNLSLLASKMSFLLLAFIAIPCIAEMPAILKLWLKDVPQYTVMFCDLVLVSLLVNQLTIGMDSAIQATGNVKKYMLYAGILKIFVLPVSWICILAGYSIYSPLFVYVTFELIGGSIRVLLLRNVSGLSVKRYFDEVLSSALVVLTTVCVLDYIIVNIMAYKYRLFITLPISVFVFVIVAFFVCFNASQRAAVIKVAHGFINRKSA